jgi:hypothetical protein
MTRIKRRSRASMSSVRPGLGSVGSRSWDPRPMGAFTWQADSEAERRIADSPTPMHGRYARPVCQLFPAPLIGMRRVTAVKLIIRVGPSPCDPGSMALPTARRSALYGRCHRSVHGLPQQYRSAGMIREAPARALVLWFRGGLGVVPGPGTRPDPRFGRRRSGCLSSGLPAGSRSWHPPAVPVRSARSWQRPGFTGPAASGCVPSLNRGRDGYDHHGRRRAGHHRRRGARTPACMSLPRLTRSAGCWACRSSLLPQPGTPACWAGCAVSGPSPWPAWRGPAVTARAWPAIWPRPGCVSWKWTAPAARTGPGRAGPARWMRSARRGRRCPGGRRGCRGAVPARRVAIGALMVAERSARRERTRAISQARALIMTGPEELRARFVRALPGAADRGDRGAAAPARRRARVCDPGRAARTGPPRPVPGRPAGPAR